MARVVPDGRISAVDGSFCRLVWTLVPLVRWTSRTAARGGQLSCRPLLVPQRDQRIDA
jgi:hypothetical protein